MKEQFDHFSLGIDLFPAHLHFDLHLYTKMLKTCYNKIIEIC